MHWLDTPQAVIRLAWKIAANGEKRIAGMVAVSRPLNGIAWLRVVALKNAVSTPVVLRTLLDVLAVVLCEQSCHTMMLMTTESWLTDHLEGLGFAHVEDVITLQRAGQSLPKPIPTQLVIRPAEREDVPRLLAVDHAAFAPPWQLAKDELSQAVRIAFRCTMALKGVDVVGYQLSTRHRNDGHLARLAVLPQLQGQGIGGVLVDDLIRRLARSGIDVLTVNTQRSNHRSQNVYKRFGFVPTGYDLPVWKRAIETRDWDRDERKR